MNKIKTLWDLYYSFAKIGTFTIGGGLAMMPMMQKELIQKKKWITEEELIDYYAVGQSTPGIVAVNVSTFVGFKEAGILGGIIATLGMVTPSLVIIMILAGLINSIDELPLVQKALKGINVAVAALMTWVIVNFAKKTIKKITNALFMLVGFVLVFFFKIPSFWIIIVAIGIGCFLTFLEQKRASKACKVSKVSKNEDLKKSEKEGE